MIATWLQTKGSSKTALAAASMMASRGPSLHSVRAMPQTAWATTATATIFRPWMNPPGRASPQRAMPRANSVSATAEGSVKPAQAASEPR